ncbi:helix-turn-helix domain-containing protein [Nonomuraea sp. SBT364]|uniref:helix-turn-helix domain-containing protein n=1 Tax=Nonomuraea sp. SBT364 TaxID=1580530 RepID=UPI00066C34C2|nr:GAF domain-containing protein [Nonomuraea sp. SBT364]
MSASRPRAATGPGPSAAELATLNDLGSRLTSIHAPGEVLRRVAAETRRLLAVDVAYIMLAGDDDVLRIEVAEGTLGKALDGIEVPAGSGLGGLIMRTGEPLWSADYLADRKLRHVPGIDAAAAAERLAGIVGVPLRVADQAIGVLFAASRAPRPFADHEVILLSSLATHAAVAIHNARLFERYQRATDALSRSVELHERLVRIATGGGGPAEIVTALADALGTEVEFLTPARRPVRAVPVLVGEELVGELVVRGAEPPAHLLETGATVLALAIATERALAEAERRARGELVAALLGGRLDASAARRRAALAGVDLDHTGSVTVLHPPAPEAAERLCRDGGWAAEHDGRSVVLLPARDPAAVRARLPALGPATVAAVAATPEAADGPAGVRRAYEEAADAVTLLRALGRTGCALADELGVYPVLLRQARSGELARFLAATIGPLLTHRRSADLVATATAYLDHHRHHADTCAVLHIHANTLYKRLRRITDLLGPGWDGPDRALETHLALRLNALPSEELTSAARRPIQEAPGHHPVCVQPPPTPNSGHHNGGLRLLLDDQRCGSHTCAAVDQLRW